MGRCVGGLSSHKHKDYKHAFEVELKFSSSYLIPKDQTLNNKNITILTGKPGAANPLLLHISYSHKGSSTWDLRKDNQDLALWLKETITIQNL